MIVVLGSASPRRKELLSPLVPGFRVEIADIDESEIPGESPVEHCTRLAREKSKAIQKRFKADEGEVCIITSDTIITAGERILGKPLDRNDAEKILNFLSGKTHQVITAITLAIRRQQAPWRMRTETDTTEVTFRNLSSDIITTYLDSVRYMDKAGAYAIQEKGEMIIQGIEGSRSNVIGFPLGLFERLVAEEKLEYIMNQEVTE